jgi:hypothetical protein
VGEKRCGPFTFTYDKSYEMEAAFEALVRGPRSSMWTAHLRDVGKAMGEAGATLYSRSNAGDAMSRFRLALYGSLGFIKAI